MILGFPFFVDWKKVTHAWIEKTFKRGVKLSYSEENYGLVISGDTTSRGCGSGIEPGALTLIKGYWTKIKYMHARVSRVSVMLEYIWGKVVRFQ